MIKMRFGSVSAFLAASLAALTCAHPLWGVKGSGQLTTGESQPLEYGEWLGPSEEDRKEGTRSTVYFSTHREVRPPSTAQVVGCQPHQDFDKLQAVPDVLDPLFMCKFSAIFQGGPEDNTFEATLKKAKDRRGFGYFLGGAFRVCFPSIAANDLVKNSLPYKQYQCFDLISPKRGRPQEFIDDSGKVLFLIASAGEKEDPRFTPFKELAAHRYLLFVAVSELIHEVGEGEAGKNFRILRAIMSLLRLERRPGEDKDFYLEKSVEELLGLESGAKVGFVSFRKTVLEPLSWDQFVKMVGQPFVERVNSVFGGAFNPMDLLRDGLLREGEEWKGKFVKTFVDSYWSSHFLLKFYEDNGCPKDQMPPRELIEMAGEEKKELENEANRFEAYLRLEGGESRVLKEVRLSLEHLIASQKGAIESLFSGGHHLDDNSMGELGDFLGENTDDFMGTFSENPLGDHLMIKLGNSLRSILCKATEEQQKTIDLFLSSSRDEASITALRSGLEGSIEQVQKDLGPILDFCDPLAAYVSVVDGVMEEKGRALRRFDEEIYSKREDKSIEELENEGDSLSETLKKGDYGAFIRMPEGGGVLKRFELFLNATLPQF